MASRAICTSLERMHHVMEHRRQFFSIAAAAALALVGSLSAVTAEVSDQGPDNFSAQQQRARATETRRAGTAVPAGETRFIPNEVIIEVEGAPSQDAVEAL